MERFEAGDAQRRDAHGEVQESFQNNVLAAILGKTAQQGALVPYEGLEKTHEHVDELDLRLNLGHYVIGEMEQSQISMAMLWPMVQLRPGVTVLEWTIERFRPGIAPIIAEEAAFPQQRFAKEPRRVGLQRRGTSVYMTANIMTPPEGMARLEQQLTKIAATMLNTFEYLIIMALLTAHNGIHYRDKITLDKYPAGQQTAEALRGQIEYDASRFAAYHRDPELQVANDMADVNRMLQQYAAPPYVFLFPQGTQNIIGGKTLDRPGRIDIKTIGPDRQILTMESMPSYYQTPDGSLAFPVKDQGFGRRGDKIQPLLRGSMISEHFAFPGLGRQNLTHRTGVQLVGEGFSTPQRNIRIYDVTVDEYVEVSFAEAFNKSGFVRDEPDNTVAINAGDYDEDSFYGPYRSAPPLYFWDRGIRRATHFGQIDSNIIPHSLHRSVGETIAAMVQVSKGDPTTAIIEGMQLVQDLESAPYDDVFAKALATDVLEPLSNIDDDARLQNQSLARVRSDVFGPNAPVNDVYVLPQDAHGMFIGNQNIGTGEALNALTRAIDAGGTPPFMASLSGLHILSTLAKRPGVSQKIMEMGKIAKKFIDAAQRIYQSLKGVFPSAMAIQSKYRPLAFQHASGFSTFFSAMFLNNQSEPLAIRNQNDLLFVTPLVVTPDQQPGLRESAAADPAFRLGSMENVSGNIGDSRVTIGQSSMRFMEAGADMPAHKKTPWMAMADMLRRTSAMAGGSAAQRRGARGLRAGDNAGEADLFGTSRASTIPIGAGMPHQFRTQGARSGYTPGDVIPAGFEEPMNTENARNAWDAADNIENQLVRVCTLTYLTATCNSMDDFMRMFDSNVLVPFGVVLLRPGLEHDMYSVVVAKSGIDTAFHALTDVVVDYGLDAGHQTRLLTFSVMHGVVMKSPDSVAILPSRMARRYLGGGGVQIYEEPGQLDEHASERPDLVPYVTPFGFTPKNYEPMGFIDVDGLYGPPGSARFAGAYEYEKVWQFSRSAMETRPFGNQWATEPSQTPNVSWTGEHLNYDRTLRTSAKGHRKGGSHPGCRAVWNANESIFPPPPRTEQA